jgi:hypothetical protein
MPQKKNTVTVSAVPNKPQYQKKSNMYDVLMDCDNETDDNNETNNETDNESNNEVVDNKSDTKFVTAQTKKVVSNPVPHTDFDASKANTKQNLKPDIRPNMKILAPVPSPNSSNDRSEMNETLRANTRNENNNFRTNNNNNNNNNTRDAENNRTNDKFSTKTLEPMIASSAIRSVDDSNIYVPPVSQNTTRAFQHNNDEYNNEERWDTVSRKKRDRGDRRENRDDNDNNDITSEDVTIKTHDSSVALKGDDMKLNSTWVVWIHDNDNLNWSLDSYEEILRIDSVGAMLRFLSTFDNLDKNIRQYYIMRNGITPIWEDNNNKNGAICSILIENINRYSKHAKGDLGVVAFAAMCILVMNESFVKNNMDINGLNYSIKSRSVLIKFWVKNYETNKNFIDKLPKAILVAIDSIISTLDNRSYDSRGNGKPPISVQIKQIKPDY